VVDRRSQVHLSPRYSWYLGEAWFRDGLLPCCSSASEVRRWTDGDKQWVGTLAKQSRDRHRFREYLVCQSDGELDTEDVGEQDDVLAENNRTLTEFHNKYFNTDLTIDDWVSYFVYRNKGWGTVEGM
jgi:hypothetical protein